MGNAKTDASNLQDAFDRSLELMHQCDAGEYRGDTTAVCAEFVDLLNDVANSPIASRDQFDVLNKGIGYLMKTDPEAPRGSVDDALYAAMEQAVRTAPSPLQGALLALARYRLERHRFDGLNA